MGRGGVGGDSGLTRGDSVWWVPELDSRAVVAVAGTGREWQTLKLIKLISQIIAVIKINGNLIVLVAYLVTKYSRITKDDSTDQTFVEGHSDI